MLEKSMDKLDAHKIKGRNKYIYSTFRKLSVHASFNNISYFHSIYLFSWWMITIKMSKKTQHYASVQQSSFQVS